MDNMVFQLNKSVSGEEYARWRDYLESKNKDAILLPDFIDYLDGQNAVFEFEEGDE